MLCPITVKMFGQWIMVFILFRHTMSSHRTDKTCSTTFKGSKGSVKSPGFPGNYSNGINCDYKIELAQNTRIRLKFNNIQLQPKDRKGRCHDYVKIYDGFSSRSKVLHKFCGSGHDVLNRGIMSSSNKIKIRFVSDSTHTDKGFELSYETYEVCPKITMKESQSSIKSPGYPNNYTRNLDCDYNIELPKNTRIKLIFREVKLQSKKYDGKCLDYIEVYDGIATWSKIIQKAFCGDGKEIVNQPILSSSNKLRVRFVSDDAISNKGFELTYDPYEPPKMTDVTQSQKVTGVVIGTACGLVFLILTFLAICHSRHLTLLRRRGRRTRYEMAATDDGDAVEEQGPPSYRDVMSSPDKYPLTPIGSRNSRRFFESEKNSESSLEDQPPRYSALMLLATWHDDSTADEDLGQNISQSVTTDV